MKVVFGIVSLLIALLIIGKLGATQLDALRSSPVAVPADATSATVEAQSRQIQQRVKNDITQALEQGAAARREAADE